MEQYIPKSALVAEIERIKKEECPIDSYEGRCKLLWFEKFLSFINTLEVKEMDLDKEIDLVEDKYRGFESLSRTDIIAIAKHFFELGLKAEKGLIDKTIEWIGEIYNYHEIIRYSDNHELSLEELTEWFKNYIKEGVKDE